VKTMASWKAFALTALHAAPSHAEGAGGLLLRSVAEEDAGAGASVLQGLLTGQRRAPDTTQVGVMALHKARPGSTVEIVDVQANGDLALVQRLMALGFVPGTRVVVRRRAPLGDPTEYALRGARISLRKREAALVTVRGLDG